MKKNIIVRLFEWLSQSINGGEKAIIDLVSAIVPYLVPIIPASLMYDHALNDMGFAPWIAKTAGVVVELLGLASVSTAVRFFLYNKRFKKDAKNENPNKAPFKQVMTIYASYVLIVLVVNVILEWQNQTRTGWTIFAIAAFSLLSFPSGWLVALRAGFSEMLEEKNASKGSSVINEKKPKHASQYKTEILAMLDAEYEKTKRVLSPKEITAKLKLDHNNNKGFVSTTTSEWRAKNSEKFTF